AIKNKCPLGGAIPDNTDPITNITAEIKIIFRRPKRSESCPDMAPPKIAPSIIEEVIQPITAALSWFQSCCRKGKAPVITPISYPNNSPTKAPKKYINLLETFFSLAINNSLPQGLKLIFNK